MPGDVGGIVAHEITHVQRVPQRLVGLEMGRAYSAIRTSASRLRSSTSASGSGAPPPSGAASARYRSSSSLPFQAFHTLGEVPRMSATVSRYSAVRCRSLPTLGGKGPDHIRVAQVGLLRDAAHRQVFAHQKLDHAGVVALDAVLAAKRRTSVRPAPSGHRRGPWRCRGTARPHTASRACPSRRPAASRTGIRARARR
jgi:hypothetical protein